MSQLQHQFTVYVLCHVIITVILRPHATARVHCEVISRSVSRIRRHRIITFPIVHLRTVITVHLCQEELDTVSLFSHSI